jgi:Matrixin
MLRAELIVGIASSLVLTLAAQPAEAYCRTRNCPDCPRDPVTGCTEGGALLAWPSSCVSFTMEESGSAYVDVDTATRLMTEAFALWSAAECDGSGAHPSIEVGVSDARTSCEDVGYSTRYGNANSVVFRDERWPYDAPYFELAATTVTSDGDGVIHDADLEINTTLPIFIAGETSAGGIVGAHDLRSIMVHEAGHFLGLDHSLEDQAIMYRSLQPGEVRSELSSDDVAAICDAYPPERGAACEAEPDNGLLTECAPSPDAGCAVRPAAPRRPGVGVLVLASTIALSLALRRRRRSVRERMGSAATERAVHGCGL